MCHKIHSYLCFLKPLDIYLPGILFSHPDVACKTCVHKILKFTGKHLCRSIVFNNAASWNMKTCNFKIEIPAQLLSCEFCETFKKTYFEASESAYLVQREQFFPFWNFSVRLSWGNGKCLVCEFRSRICGKIAWKGNVWKGKEKVWNFTKNDFVYRDFSKTPRRKATSEHSHTDVNPS